MSKQSARDKILESALTLLNDEGFANVTTNHIAAAAGISPGNLYYHFKNKEEIIRTLVLEQLKPSVAEVWARGQATDATLADLQSMIRSHFELFWRFRFMRDVLAIMRNDPLFARGFQALYQQRIEEFFQLGKHFITVGIFRPVDAQTLHDVIEICWLITQYWLAHLTATGSDITPGAMQRGADLMLLTLRPYLNNVIEVGR